jgi:hypothetical protein
VLVSAQTTTVAYEARKSTLGNPRVRELSPVVLSCPAAFPVPAFFSLPASAVLAAASAEPGLVSPLPGEQRIPADALSAASAGEEPAHSGSAPDDNSVAPRVDGHCALGAERRDEAHLADSRVAIGAADRFPDDCWVVAARVRGLAQVDSESPADDRLANLSPADCSVAVMLVDCSVAAVLADDLVAPVWVDWAQQPDVRSEVADLQDGSPVGSPVGLPDGPWPGSQVFPEVLASPSAELRRGSPGAGSALRFSPTVVRDGRPAPAAV